MAKQVTGKGKVETAYGQALSEIKKADGTFHEPFEYEFTYEALDNMEEVRAKGEMLSDKEYVSVINNARKAKSRSARVQELLDEKGIAKPTLENNPDLQFKTLVNVLVASGRSEKEAEQIARATLGQSEAA